MKNSQSYFLISGLFLVAFLYGSMIWYIFPIKSGMSWQGHLSGLLTGFLFALLFRKKIAQPEKYIWESPEYSEEDDPFMKHFDKDGNFIEQIDQGQEDDENTLSVNYIYKDSKD